MGTGIMAARVMIRVEGVGRHGYMASGWPGREFGSGWGRVLGWGRSGLWFGSSVGSIVNTPKCSINIIYIYIYIYVYIYICICVWA
jgi:hypothetical protein